MAFARLMIPIGRLHPYRQGYDGGRTTQIWLLAGRASLIVFYYSRNIWLAQLFSIYITSLRGRSPGRASRRKAGVAYLWEIPKTPARQRVFFLFSDLRIIRPDRYSRRVHHLCRRRVAPTCIGSIGSGPHRRKSQVLLQSQVYAGAAGAAGAGLCGLRRRLYNRHSKRKRQVGWVDC